MIEGENSTHLRHPNLVTLYGCTLKHSLYREMRRHFYWPVPSISFFGAHQKERLVV